MSPAIGLSLAQRIADLDAPAPKDFDIENIDHGLGEVELESRDEEAARGHYLEVGPSSLRKQQQSISDPKYDGKKTSRKQLMDDSGEESGSEAHDGPLDEEESQEETYPADGDDVHSVTSEGEGDQGTDNDEGEEEEMEYTVLRRPRTAEATPAEDLASAIKKSREGDRKKGEAVSRQLSLWNSLLDSRIRMQKAVTSTNRLPDPRKMKDTISEGEESRNSLDAMLKEAVLLSQELSELQENLLRLNGPIAPRPRKRRKLDDEDTVTSWKEELTEETQHLVNVEHALHPHLIQMLKKWSAKIQAVAPPVLLPSNRNAFSKSNQHLRSVVELVNDTMVDHEKLLARTRVWRGKGSRIGASNVALDEEPGPDYEIFDDTDFYQQLLRDVIDSQGGRDGDDWMAIPKQKKAKKKVDTKASKGRKLRYEVHEKLQNFMVPVPVTSSWHEEQVDELFASILGKGFEDALDSVAPVESARQADEAVQGGFRVF